MKIGIISDTHDDIENVQKAIEMFNLERVQYVIHAGDYILQFGFSVATKNTSQTTHHRDSLFK